MSRQETWKYDEVEDRLIIKKTTDITSVLEANKVSYNHADGTHKSEAANHVARIPVEIIAQYRSKGIDLIKDQEAMRQFLNDPDNRLFRTAPGKV